MPSTFLSWHSSLYLCVKVCARSRTGETNTQLPGVLKISLLAARWSCATLKCFSAKAREQAVQLSSEFGFGRSASIIGTDVAGVAVALDKVQPDVRF